MKFTLEIDVPDTFILDREKYVIMPTKQQVLPNQYFWDATIGTHTQWVFEEKSVGKFPVYTKVRWRAKKGEPYYFTNSGSRIRILEGREDGHSVDDNYYGTGNYFKTEEEAQKYLDAFVKILQERSL